MNGTASARTDAPPDPSAEDIAGWLALFSSPEAAIEIRAPGHARKDGKGPETVVRRFGPADIGEAASVARILSGHAPAVYFVMNGIAPALVTKRTKGGASAADIPRRRFLLIDCDPKRPGIVSSTDAEKAEAWTVAQAARKALRARGWPDPIIADSGNGYHLVYALDLPNDDESTGLVKGALEALARQYGSPGAKVDTKVHDAPRLVKLYGTLVMKGEATAERPHRFARVLVHPDQLAPVASAKLAELAAEGKPVPKPEANRAIRANGQPRGDAAGGRWTPEMRAIAYLEKCDPAISGDGGHDQAFKTACKVGPGFDLHPSTAFRLLAEYWNPRCEPPWTDHELQHKVDEAYKIVTDKGSLLNADRNGYRGNGKPTLNGTPPGDYGPQEADTPARAPFALTDMGNGERMVALFGDRFRYCHVWGKWLVWDGHRWAIDNTAAAYRMAKRTVRSIYKEASKTGDVVERKAIAAWARVSEGKGRVEAMLWMAAREDGIQVTPDQLDRDPWLLNVRNGTIDLHTGKLRPYDPTDLITKMAPVDFLGLDAQCPFWEATINTFIIDGSITLYWQRMFGYSTTGVIREQVLPVAWGEGANGKSTILGTMLAVLGPDYAMKTSPDLLMQRKGEAHPTERASLFGKRLVVAIETNMGQSINESLIKELTGSDRISARRMREDFWEFEPTHKIFLGTNHKPQVRGTDHALWRRLKLVPFGFTMPKDEAKLDAAERLKAEFPGILAWAVRGCLDWQKNGLGEPEAVTEATQRYREEEDILAPFYSENTFIGPGARVRANAIYERYRKWAERSGFSPLSQKKFGPTILERGKAISKDTSNGTWYHGIGLRPENDWEQAGGRDLDLEPLEPLEPMLGKNEAQNPLIRERSSKAPMVPMVPRPMEL